MSPWIFIDDQDDRVVYHGVQWEHVFGSASVGIGESDGIMMDTESFVEVENGTQAETRPSLSIPCYGLGIQVASRSSEDLDAEYWGGDNLTRELTIPANAKLTSTPNWSTTCNTTSSLLNITVPSGNASFDYFLIAPDARTSLDGELIIVDDHDNQWIKYNGNWIPGVDEEMFQSTQTWSKTVGDGMTVVFFGTEVGVFAALRQLPGRLSVNYSLDGDAPQTLVLVDGTESSSDLAAPHVTQPIVSLSNLSPFMHTLSVVVNEATEEQALHLDCFMFKATSMATIVPPDTSRQDNRLIVTIASVIGAIGLLILAFVAYALRHQIIESLKPSSSKKQLIPISLPGGSPSQSQSPSRNLSSYPPSSSARGTLRSQAKPEMKSIHPPGSLKLFSATDFLNSDMPMPFLTEANDNPMQGVIPNSIVSTVIPTSRSGSVSGKSTSTITPKKYKPTKTPKSLRSNPTTPLSAEAILNSKIEMPYLTESTDNLPAHRTKFSSSNVMTHSASSSVSDVTARAKVSESSTTSLLKPSASGKAKFVA